MPRPAGDVKQRRRDVDHAGSGGDCLRSSDHLLGRVLLYPIEEYTNTWLSSGGTSRHADRSRHGRPVRRSWTPRPLCSSIPGTPLPADRGRGKAGVAIETVYKVFGSKKALLSALVDRTVAGDDEPVPLAAGSSSPTSRP